MSKLVVDATGNDLTYRIIGAAMSIHNKIGPGFKEEIYERALKNELINHEMETVYQFPVPVEVDGEQIGLFYLDLLVEELVVVEIKAFAHQLTNDEIAQVLNYLKATELQVGLLFNFDRRKLEYRRIFPSKNITSIQRVGRDDVQKSDRS